MSDYVKPQPAPQNAEGSQPVWAMVLADIDHQCRKGIVPDRNKWELLRMDACQRNEDGIRKYGVPLVVHSNRDAGRDAYQEALDGCVYWRQEWERTQDEYARALYDSALYHAMHCRDYLLRRDGK